MVELSLSNMILKYTFICLITFYIFAKSLDFNFCSKKSIILFIVCSIIMSFIYTYLVNFVSSFFVVLILVFLISLVAKFKFKIKLEHSLIVSLLSMAISFSCYFISLVITSIFVKLPAIKLDTNNPIILIICVFLECIIINRFFHTKRFSHGFSFLKTEERIYNFSIIGLVLAGNFIIFFTVMANIKNRAIQQFGIIGFALIIIGTFIWIKRNITLDYQDRMKNRKIENLEKELADKEKINAELTEEIKSLTMINHQYNSRIKAAKQEIEKLAFAFKNSTNTEFSTELSEVTKLVNNLSSEYSNKVNSVLKYSKPLPKTNVKGVDSILEHMKLEATKKNIDFDLKVNCSVKHLIEKFISQSELETLISDHVKDAIIAVGYSESTPRSICVIFDIIDNCYRFSVYDSGIDFEINTLVNLGLDAITTHKDDGGTGLGFLTTFGTLDKCKASLVIDEINFKNSNFSKSVNIIFDEKHEYIVRSSRTEEIKKFDKNSRIILQNKD